MKAVVFTLGCKVNECESDSLISGLIERGYQVFDKLVFADLYIVNTCAVTSEAEKKSRQCVARINRINPNAKIIFTGCATQNNPNNFIGKKNVVVITGTFNKGKILQHLDDNGVFIDDQPKDFEELLISKSLRTRGYIKVQDGCNNFCSYCLIPYVRGRERSRDFNSIISEIQNTNYKETIINGINLSSYNYQGVNLAGLMQKLSFVNTRIRLGSLEVRVITKELLSSLKGLKDFAEQFHLSLQSGANEVLKKMNRHYTREEYLEKVNLIREYFPNAGITTDVIVGFPNETEGDFLDTLDLIEKVEFSDIHPFIYSPRQGTVAYKMKDLPYEIKKQRLDRLIDAKLNCKNNFALKMKDKTLSVLFEENKDGYFTGYSENYLRLYTKDNVKLNEITKVKVLSPYLDGAKCIIDK